MELGATFRALRTSGLESRNLFVISGDVVEGSVAAGMRVHVPLNSAVSIEMTISSVDDLVGSEIRITGQPDQVPPIARIAIPDIEQHGYRAYPLADHIADKVAAILQSYGAGRVPSTRYEDLVDLVAIVPQATVEAEPQRTAIDSEADRRDISLSAAFSVPDRGLWEKGYAAEARRSLLDAALTLDDALAVVTRFLNPLLDGTGSGVWEPREGRWTG